MKFPFFSVIIITYNRGNLLPRAISSVLNQTFQNFELIVVDDASTDNTSHVMSKYRSNKIKYIIHEQNSGLPSARNTGIKNSRGKWIILLDDDDEFKENRLEEQYKQIIKDNNAYKIYYCGTRLGPQSEEVGIPLAKGDIWRLLMRGWTPPNSAQCFHTDVLKKINYFDTDLRSGIDHDLWFKLGVQGFKTGLVPKVLVKLNKNHHRMTSNYNDRIKGIEDFLKKWKKLIIYKEGEKVFNKFYNGLLSMEHARFVSYYFQKKDYLKVMRELFLVLRYNPQNTVVWERFVYHFFGTKLRHKHKFYIRGLD